MKRTSAQRAEVSARPQPGAELGARLEEEHEWLAQRALAAVVLAAEEAEWQLLRERALEALRVSEEREWQDQIARARRRTSTSQPAAVWPPPPVHTPRAA